MRVKLQPHDDGALLVLPENVNPPDWWRPGVVVKMELLARDGEPRAIVISPYRRG